MPCIILDCVSRDLFSLGQVHLLYSFPWCYGLYAWLILYHREIKKKKKKASFCLLFLSFSSCHHGRQWKCRSTLARKIWLTIKGAGAIVSLALHSGVTVWGRSNGKRCTISSLNIVQDLNVLPWSSQYNTPKQQRCLVSDYSALRNSKVRSWKVTRCHRQVLKKTER